MFVQVHLLPELPHTSQAPVSKLSTYLPCLPFSALLTGAAARAFRSSAGECFAAGVLAERSPGEAAARSRLSQGLKSGRELPLRAGRSACLLQA